MEKNEIKLEDYEEICPACKGERIIIDGVIFGKEVERIDSGRIICPKCNGKGKVDWVDRVKNKDYEEVKQIWKQRIKRIGKKFYD